MPRKIGHPMIKNITFTPEKAQPEPIASSGVAEAVKQERDRCAKIAEDVYLHTASMTEERDFARRILPRVAAAIRNKE